MSNSDEMELQFKNYKAEQNFTQIENSRLLELLKIESEVSFDTEIHEMYEKMVDKNAVLTEDYNKMTERYDKLKVKFEQLQKSTNILVQNSSPTTENSEISDLNDRIKKLELKKSELIRQNIDEVRQKEAIISEQNKSLSDYG